MTLLLILAWLATPSGASVAALHGSGAAGKMLMPSATVGRPTARPNDDPRSPETCTTLIFGAAQTCTLWENHAGFGPATFTDGSCPGGLSLQWDFGDGTIKTHHFSNPCGGTTPTPYHAYKKDEQDKVDFVLTGFGSSSGTVSATWHVTFTEGDYLLPLSMPAIKMEPNKPVPTQTLARFVNASYPTHIVRDFRAMIDWGDGSKPVKGTITGGSADRGDVIVSGPPHTYKEPGPDKGGPYNITVSIKDDVVIATATRPVAALEIVDDRTGHLVSEDKPLKTIVGEQTTLAARMTDGSAMSNPQWSGLDDAVSDYTIGATSAAAPTPVTVLDEPTVTFHSWRVDTPSYDVSVTTDQGSTRGTVEVSVPNVTSGTPATTCAADVNHHVRSSPPPPVGDDRQLHPPSFGLGLNDTCGNTPGILWNIPVSAPDIGGGDVQLVQLVSEQLVHDAKTCGNRPYGADIASFVADQHGNAITSHVPAGGSATWTRSDSPFTKFVLIDNTFGKWSRSFKAIDYIMFRATKDGSIWVPLGSMSWSFNASAQYSFMLLFPHWSITLLSANVVAPVFSPGGTSLPTWTRAWQPIPQC